jgi:hypothetical protein
MLSLKAIVLGTVLFFSGFSPAHVNPAPHFHSEQEAKQHCPNDTAVWVNRKTGVYHFTGERYGATKEGAYQCRKEADAEGDRATGNCHEKRRGRGELPRSGSRHRQTHSAARRHSALNSLRHHWMHDRLRLRAV